MNLDMFSNLLENFKINSGVQKFMKELSNFLEENLNDKIKKDEVKDISILQQIQEETKVTTNYRDKMSIERMNILNAYEEQTFEKGEMYYIYSKDLGEDVVYNLCNCQKGKSNKIIELQESKLPKGAGVDSILRIQNGEFVLDTEATAVILNEIKKMANQLLIEQQQELKDYRIEGHLYEFVEKNEESIWLIDRTKSDGNCFEEIEFPKELLEKSKKDCIFQYKNGEYELYLKD